MTANGIGTTWNELLAVLDAYLDALGADGAITPADFDDRAADLTDRAEMLQHAAWRMRCDRDEVGVTW